MYSCRIDLSEEQEQIEVEPFNVKDPEFLMQIVHPYMIMSYRYSQTI